MAGFIVKLADAPTIGRGPRLGLREGDRPIAVPGRQWRRPTIFRRARERALHREAKSPAFAILRFASALRWCAGCRPAPPMGFVAMKAATVAVHTDGASHVRARRLRAPPRILAH